jgi:hypothetical protein
VLRQIAKTLSGSSKEAMDAKDCRFCNREKTALKEQLLASNIIDQDCAPDRSGILLGLFCARQSGPKDTAESRTGALNSLSVLAES